MLFQPASSSLWMHGIPHALHPLKEQMNTTTSSITELLPDEVEKACPRMHTIIIQHQRFLIMHAGAYVQSVQEY